MNKIQNFVLIKDVGVLAQCGNDVGSMHNYTKLVHIDKDHTKEVNVGGINMNYVGECSYLKCDYLNGKLLKLPCWSWSCWCVVSNPCYNSLLNCFVYVIIWFRSWTCASCKKLIKFLYSCKTMFSFSKLRTISIQVGTNKKREKNNLIPQWKEEK